MHEYIQHWELQTTSVHLCLICGLWVDQELHLSALVNILESLTLCTAEKWHAALILYKVSSMCTVKLLVHFYYFPLELVDVYQLVMMYI